MEKNNGVGNTTDKIRTRELSAWTDGQQLLRNVSLGIPDRAVTAIIGPSGCGKSTLLRCLNRLHELGTAAQVVGEVTLDGLNVYAAGVDPRWVRRHVGMVFQKPNAFGALSVRQNVLAGLELNDLQVPYPDDLVERCLRDASLWDEVYAELQEPASRLSPGQQQRLSIARALALDPVALVMDEPCAVLDPIATAKVEEVIRAIGETRPVVVATHHLQQAARVADYTAFMNLGELVEFDRTDVLFTTPRSQRTEDYITGRYG